MSQLIVLTAALLLLSSISMAQGPRASLPQSNFIDVRQLLRDLQVLSADDMEGRKTGTRGNAKAREYIVQRFQASGILSFGRSYVYPFDRGVNVAGYIKGKTNPEMFLVISAHYDHEGIQNGRIFNGANDNASGVSALFALGALLNKNPLNNSILFVAFDGEEDGLLGSRAFLRSPPVAKDAMLININLDMIGRDKNRALYVIGTYLQPFLRPYLEKILPRSGVRLVPGHDRPGSGDDDWSDDSDHYSFHREGIPFIFFSAEDYDYYHTPNDDYDNMMPDFYVASLESIVDLVRGLDQSFKR